MRLFFNLTYIEATRDLLMLLSAAFWIAPTVQITIAISVV